MGYFNTGDFSLEESLKEAITISFETMDSLIRQEHTIESFITTIMGEEYDAVVTDEPEKIWELLNNGYRVLCSLNDILHYDVKNNPNRFYYGGYHKVEKIILIKFNFHDWIYKELENEATE